MLPLIIFLLKRCQGFKTTSKNVLFYQVIVLTGTEIPTKLILKPFLIFSILSNQSFILMENPSVSFGYKLLQIKIF